MAQPSLYFSYFDLNLMNVYIVDEISGKSPSSIEKQNSRRDKGKCMLLIQRKR